MASFDLASMWRRERNPRRKSVTLRPIAAPSAFAANLYQAAYRETVRIWEAALPGILAAYERTLAEMTTDAPADVSAEITTAEASNASVMVALRVRLERWAQLLEQFQRRKWRANVLSATGVDLQTMIGPEDMRLTVEAAIERNVALVKSVSEQTRQRIADAVFRGLNERRPVREIAKELRETVGMARRRALNIASDQTVKLASALNEERRRQAGISAWAWVSSHKVNYRPEHAARDGKLYTDDPAQVGVKEGGKTVRKAPEDRPGQLPFCACTARAVLLLD